MEYSLGILLCSLGVLVLVWAFVRPRHGDEPHCRACRFSLAGLTEPGRCPECGRDLSRPRSKVKGHRPSPKRAAFWCLGLVLMGGALIGLDAMNRTGFFPLTKYKPAFVLQAEAYVLGDLRASMATDELVDRINGGTLGKEAEDRLVKTALARHAQTWRGFPDAQWGVITAAMGTGRMSVEQIQRVWDDCIADMRVVEVGKGERSFLPGERIEIVMGLDFRAGELGDSSSGIGYVALAALRASLQSGDSQEKLVKSQPFGSPVIVYVPPSGVLGTEMDQEFEFTLTVPDEVGEYSIDVVLECKVINDSMTRQWTAYDSDFIDTIPELKRTIKVPVTIRVAESDAPDLPVVDPSTLGVITPIDFQIVKIDADRGHGPTLVFRYQIKEEIEAGIGFGGHLVFEQDGKELLSPLDNKRTYLYLQSVLPLRDFRPGEVRVRYEYDREHARKIRSSMSSVLGGPIDLGTFTIPEPETPEPQ